MPAQTIDPDTLAPTSKSGKAQPVPDFYLSVISAINAHATSIDTQVNSGILVPEAYGASGDGTTDDLSAFKAMLVDASASNGMARVQLGPKTYAIGRDGNNAYCLNLACSNVEISGIPGKSVIMAKAGLPASSVTLVKCDSLTNVRFRNVVFDGNWGNAATTIEQPSSDVGLPTGTIRVVSTSGFPGAGTITVVTTAGPQVVTYTATSPSSFMGCSGGTGTMVRGYGVGSVNGNIGINHATQADPKNYLLQLPGSSNVTIEKCIFRQAYGDFIWLGASGTDPDNVVGSTNIRILDCDMNIAARHGVSMSGQSGILIDRCTIANVFGSNVFEQSNNRPNNDVTISKSQLLGWFDPSRNNPNGFGDTAITTDNVAGGMYLMGSANRNWKVVDCNLMGGVIMGSQWDLVFRGNHSIVNWSTSGSANLKVQTGGGAIRIEDNYFYSRAGVLNPIDGGGNTGCVVLLPNSPGNDGAAHAISPAQSSTIIANNIIHSRNGRHGIVAVSAGGAIKTVTGTATVAPAALSVTDSGAAWATNEWKECVVRIGSAWATVASNTPTVLTLQASDPQSATAWRTAYGDFSAQPTSTSYVLFRPTGACSIGNNEIHCGDDGNGAGGKGIYLTCSTGTRTFGGRWRVKNNNLKNCNTDGIYVAFAAAVTYPLIELVENYGWDDQATPTFTNLITFNGTPNVTTWIMRGNIVGENVTNLYSGIASGTWIRQPGSPADWEGYGAPGMSAAKGSTYRRLDGGAGTCFYVNESGSSTWTAK